VAFIAAHRSMGVLIHCKAGISRSPALCAAYLARHEAIPVVEALEVVCLARPIARPHPAFLPVIERFMGTQSPCSTCGGVATAAAGTSAAAADEEPL